MSLSLFVVAALTAAAPVPPQTATPKADLAQAVQHQIKALGLKKAAIGVSIRDVATGKVVASFHADDPMTPASNMKLLTTGAALVTLGREFSFETRLLKDGERLVVVGDGDPALGDPELLAQSSFVNAAGVVHTGMTIEDLLQSWIRAVAATGAKSISEVVVDDRIFAREGAHPSWPKDQLDEDYCTAPSGLNFHGNALHVSIAANAGGAPKVTSLSPAAPWITIQNKGTCRAGKNDRNTAWIARAADTGALTIYGNVKTTLVSPIAVGITDPAAFLGQCLADRLRRVGVAVGIVRVAGAKDPAPAGSPIGPVLRTPLTTVITRCNVESDNLYAESLMKRVGAKIAAQPGTWANGSRAISQALQAIVGSSADGFVVSDGSGLSRDNRVSADGVTVWLAALAADSTVGPAFVGSLAVAGQSGTVRKRMKDINPALAVVQCKTGYIDKVSCLSGYVTSGNGTRYAFSVLGNNLSERDSVGKLKGLQDKIARLIADTIGAPSKQALGG